MILVITTCDHGYTHESLHRERGLDLDVITYEKVLGRRALQRATHIFTDLDRLSDAQLHDAALLYRRLRDAGVRALNDPARFLGRYGLLRALNRAGINKFDAYRVESEERPRRWPVFLRLEGDHAFPVSGLIQNERELEAAIAKAVDEGAPKSALLIIEYAAEPLADGVYRKLSVFRVGDRFLGYTCVHENNWLVKYGTLGLANDELYAEEQELVRNNPYADAVKPAFDLAGIEYGRVDFGIVDGKPQIYEINNNPYVTLGIRAGAPDRRNESNLLFRRNYLDAMDAIDTYKRPSWQASASALRRAVRHSPPRIRRLAASVVRKLGRREPRPA